MTPSNCNHQHALTSMPPKIILIRHAQALHNVDNKSHRPA
jgi:hypothetical protein